MSPEVQFLLILAIILIAAKAAGLLATRVGQAAVLGELLAGVLLGPTGLDLFDLGFITEPHLEDTTLLLAELGVVLLMFLAGLETDLDEVNRVRTVALLTGVFGVVLPATLGAAAAASFGYSPKEAVFVGIILSATSISISARTLMELGMLQTRQGVSILAAAVIDDVLVLLMLSFFAAFAIDDTGTAGVGEVMIIVGQVFVFFVVAMLVGRFLLPLLLRWSSTAPMSEGVAATAIVVALLYAWFSEYVGGIALITGAFLAGILLSRSELRRVMREKLHTIAYAFFIPIFFVGVGLSADARGFDASDVLFLLVISVVAALSKLVGSGLGARLGGESTRSSLQIGSGMVARGEVGLIVATLGLAEGFIDTNGFSVIVFMIVANAVAAPLLLRAMFKGGEEAEYA